MDKETLPILFSRLRSGGSRNWPRPYNDQQLARLTDALSQWEAAQQRGFIENARFTESRQVISRALEDAWDSFHRDNEWICSLDRPHQETLDGPRPTLSTIKGRLKRVQKTPDSPLRDELEALLTEALVLSDAYDFLKQNARKKVFNTQSQEDKFTPPPSNSEAVKKVRRVLERAIDSAYQQLLERNKNRNRSIIAKYLQAQEKVMSDSGRTVGYSPKEHFTVRPGGRSRGYVSDPAAVLLLGKVLDRKYVPGSPMGSTVQYSASPASYKLSDEIAEKDTKLIRDQFLYKSLVKLTPILEAKGDDLFESIKQVGDFSLQSMEGEFDVRFKDGSSFKLKNAVVFVVNQFQTHFCRFPTTFHDVVLPDGSIMSHPSEERMHKVFAAASPPPSKPLKIK